VLASYAGAYTRLERGPFRQGVSTPEAAALFEFIREHTHPDDVVVFQKPRALALYTGRQASGHHYPPSDEHLWRYLRQIGATHVVVTPQLRASCAVLRPFVRRCSGRLEEVFAGEFTVYRVRQTPVAAR
jgi:hypothetical protein